MRRRARHGHSAVEAVEIRTLARRRRAEEKNRIFVLAGVLAVAGCTVGPSYRPPELGAPAAWKEAPAKAATAVTTTTSEWWAAFSDPTLDRLVEHALASNLDLERAVARVREARALRGVAGAALWPSLDARAEYDHREGSTGSGGAGSGEATTGESGSGGGASDIFLGALDALWEIDLFGGARRSVEAADADAAAAVEARREIALAVAGEVAETYVELRGSQRSLRAVRGNLALQEETLGITEARVRAGLASGLDAERARAQVRTTAAELAPLEAAVQSAVHRLGVLVGEGPAALAGELEAAAPIPVPRAAMPPGVPADLLRRRPDLRRAERELAAATARIGEAEADLYPRLTLTGSLGLRSEDVKRLVEGGSSFSSVGPSVVWPVFAAGRIRANVEVQEARREQALAGYRQALLLALEDVENALARHLREQSRRRDLAGAVTSSRGAAALARRLYANGLSDFLDVLDAERSLLESESRLVESETAVATSRIALHVALGGGWEAAEPRERSR
jgi:NodT family efflux transporter outer membrane factor (OMF) lipoprotein